MLGRSPRDWLTKSEFRKPEILPVKFWSSNIKAFFPLNMQIVAEEILLEDFAGFWWWNDTVRFFFWEHTTQWELENAVWLRGVLEMLEVGQLQAQRAATDGKNQPRPPAAGLRGDNSTGLTRSQAGECAGRLPWPGSLELPTCPGSPWISFYTSRWSGRWRQLFNYPLNRNIENDCMGIYGEKSHSNVCLWVKYLPYGKRGRSSSLMSHCSGQINHWNNLWE